MLSELLFVRLRAAENALRDGRLDEAYRLATAADLREHRRGASVLKGLADRFLDRARNHFRADRFVEALQDLDRAAAGGVLTDQIAELRSQVQTVMAEQQRNATSRRDRMADARRRIKGGSLAAGRRILEEASKHDHAAQDLARQAGRRADEASDLVSLAEKLIDQGQLAAAAERVKQAKSVDSHNPALAQTESRVCIRVLENARKAMTEGRLDRAGDELACLGTLGDALPAKRELTDVLAVVRKAAECIGADRYADALRQAMTLGRLLPKTPWIETTIEQLRQLDGIRNELFAGPLGESMSSSPPEKVPAPKRAPLDETVAVPVRVPSDDVNPERLLLLIDGGGSFLLLRNAQTSIGRAASDDPADVPLYSDISERHASVTRVDEDYFLVAGRDVEVAGNKGKHHLLRNGDRAILGRKAKLIFSQPSRKSMTAVLSLSDTTKMPNDVRRVILFDRHATIGQGSTVHIPCRHAGKPLILFERGGSMWIRAKNDGHVDTEAKPLTLGEPIEMGGVSMVLERWKPRIPGGPAV